MIQNKFDVKRMNYFFLYIIGFLYTFSMKKILILALLLNLILSDPCPINYQISLLQSSSAYFATSTQNQQITNSIYDHSFYNTFQSIPSVAYSIHSLGINKGIATSWSITSHLVNNTKLSIKFTHKPIQWTLIKIGFWVTTRTDVRLGSTSMNFDTLKQGIKTISINLANPIPSPQTAFMKVFISGFTIISGFTLNIKCFQRPISAKRIQFGVQVGGQMEITQVHLSYIIIPLQNTEFISYFGGVSQSNFEQGKVYNLHKVIQSSPYKFYGLTNLKHSKSTPLMLLSDINNDFYLRFDTLQPTEEVSLFYIMIGVKTLKLCQKCDMKTVYMNQCRDECDPESYLFVYKDGGKGCRRCPSQYNMTVNSLKNGCICKEGYQQSKGYCIMKKDQEREKEGRVKGKQQEITNTKIQQKIDKEKNMIEDNKVEKKSIIVPIFSSDSVSFQSQIENRKSNQNLREISSQGNRSQKNINLNRKDSQTKDTFNLGRNLDIMNQKSSVQNNSKQFNSSIVPNNIDLRVAKPFSTSPVMTTRLPLQSGEKQIKREQTINQALYNRVGSVVTSNTSEQENQKSLSVNKSFKMQKSSQYYIPTQKTHTNYFSQQNTLPTFDSIIRDIVKLKKNECSLFNNSYWTGYTCACKAGYILVSGICSKLSIIKNNGNIFKPSQFTSKISLLYKAKKLCQKANQYNDGRQCICIQGRFRNEQGQCQLEHIKEERKQNQLNCPPNSKLIQSKCSCNKGYILSQGDCLPDIKCGPYSILDEQGNCLCIEGYQRYNNSICSRCPVNKFMVSGTCQTLSGQNQIFSQTDKKFICIEGFGRYFKKCQICPNGFIIKNDFCVQCPINSYFHDQLNKCLCKEGYQYKNKSCTRICQHTQLYDSIEKICYCKKGLRKNKNGKCMQCNSENNYICEQSCKVNQIYINQGCICKQQFGYVGEGLCERCQKFNSFLRKGFCVSCPQNMKPSNGKCVCQSGMKQSESMCIKVCPEEMLIDYEGLCYSCLVNEEVRGNICVCKNGFQRRDGVCKSICKKNEIEVAGVCAYCALNTQYNIMTKRCQCPKGNYMSQFGICQISQISCLTNQFYSRQQKICKQCEKGCLSCSSKEICNICQFEGFYPPFCKSKCGDGVKTFEENCDDGNTEANDGCYNCVIQGGWACVNRECSKFEQVKKNVVSKASNETKTNIQKQKDIKDIEKENKKGEQQNQSSASNKFQNPDPGFNLFLGAQAYSNQNSVFIQLQTPKQFKFSNEAQMKSFIKYQVREKDVTPSSAYCLQKLSNKKIFECLLIYTPSIPKRAFSIQFSYKYSGERKVQNGSIKVQINPNKMLKTRSRK